ncbi:FhaA domain-containing protein, partial [Curtobacterium sp. UCD-KPL2560]|uniref:FhaA domain-containing protein n=1 Tax=Curtobacterium sp. UCD-KPL2560 TaxID=1885315 RepID=UPI00209A7ED9
MEHDGVEQPPGVVGDEFAVRLAPPDFTRMNDVGRPLIDELTSMVQQHAVAQNYSFSAVAQNYSFS